MVGFVAGSTVSGMRGSPDVDGGICGAVDGASPNELSGSAADSLAVAPSAPSAQIVANSRFENLFMAVKRLNVAGTFRLKRDFTRITGPTGVTPLFV